MYSNQIKLSSSKQAYEQPYTLNSLYELNHKVRMERDNVSNLTNNKTKFQHTMQAMDYIASATMFKSVSNMTFVSPLLSTSCIASNKVIDSMTIVEHLP